MAIMTLTIPRTFRKNRRHVVHFNRKTGKRFVANSDDYEDFCETVRIAWLEAKRPRINSGRWAMKLVAYWDRERHLDVDLPMADVDACISGVLDALEECGCLDDDMRIVEVSLAKRYDKANPRIEIEAWEL